MSKQAISLDSVDLDKIVVSNKCKINETTYKYLCGYLNNDVIQSLCVILPQMDGYIKYFDNGGKNMTFVTDNEKVYDKYNEIWEVIRKLLKVKFTVNPVRDDKYLVAKLKIFNRINRTTFNNNNNDNKNNNNNNNNNNNIPIILMMKLLMKIAIVISMMLLIVILIFRYQIVT